MGLKEGAEAVVPDLMDFLNYSVCNNQYRAEFLGAKKTSDTVSKTILKAIAHIRKPAPEALKKSCRFDASSGLKRNSPRQTLPLWTMTPAQVKSIG